MNEIYRIYDCNFYLLYLSGDAGGGDWLMLFPT
jgi:hypothetical protein